MVTLEELQTRELARLNWRKLLTATGLTAEAEAALEAYFARFLPPGPCVMCGEQLGTRRGHELMDFLLGAGTFEWGLAHGEGFCRTCHYPARAYHRDVGPITFLQVILQYHPSELTKREKS